jgi:hypothetical protein
MAKRLLIVCFVLYCAPAWVDAVPRMALAQTPDYPPPPPARLIRPRAVYPEPRPVERPRPLDDRCRALKEQLEIELQRSGGARRAFQARVAHNAGVRLCREGHPDKGMAEFERGLSYLQGGPHY